MPLAPLAGAPALAVWVAPDGPPPTRDTTPTGIEPWRPGLDGLDAQSLADVLAYEALAADDVRDSSPGVPTSPPASRRSSPAGPGPTGAWWRPIPTPRA